MVHLVIELYLVCLCHQILVILFPSGVFGCVVDGSGAAMAEVLLWQWYCYGRGAAMAVVLLWQSLEYYYFVILCMLSVYFFSCDWVRRFTSANSQCLAFILCVCKGIIGRARASQPSLILCAHVYMCIVGSLPLAHNV